MEASANLQYLKKASYDDLLRLVQVANQFESYILIESDTFSVNIKSMLALSILPFLTGELRVKAYGPDAQAAIQSTKDLLRT